MTLGLPPDQVGGKSMRIRGATDIAAEWGDEGGAKIVQQLGRWHSDVSHIYSRAQAQKLLDATATMANAAGGSLEALIPEWTQPAWRSCPRQSPAIPARGRGCPGAGRAR